MTQVRLVSVRKRRRAGVATGLALGTLLVLVGCGADDTQTAGAGIDPTLAPLLRRSFPSEPAPDSFRVVLDTSRGRMVVEVHRGWAPLGADRLFTLVGLGYFDGVRFHRVLDGYLAGFGIHGDPRVNAVWRPRIIEDDPPGRSNLRGTLSFASGGPNSRTTELFINLRDNSALDELGFVPVGRVVEGMDAADGLFAGYGDGPPRGDGPYAAMAQARGNAYLAEEFPELDWIRQATIETPGDRPLEASR